MAFASPEVGLEAGNVEIKDEPRQTVEPPGSCSSLMAASTHTFLAACFRLSPQVGAGELLSELRFGKGTLLLPSWSNAILSFKLAKSSHHKLAHDGSLFIENLLSLSLTINSLVVAQQRVALSHTEATISVLGGEKRQLLGEGRGAGKVCVSLLNNANKTTFAAS